MSCTTPEVSLPQIVHVKLSLNGQDYIQNTQLSFSYQYHPVVTQIDPVYGSVKGNTLITVTGRNFLDGEEDISCRFGDQRVSGNRISTNSISCKAPAIESKYEIQALDVGILPYIPQIQRISIATEPITGDTIQIRTYTDPWIPQVDVIETKDTRVNDVQKILISMSPNPPKILEINVHSAGRYHEIQIIETTVTNTPEIQAVYIRSPITNVFNGAIEIQFITISDTSATLTITFPLNSTTSLSIPASVTAEYFKSALESSFLFASNCNVTLSVFPFSRTFTISYQMGYIPDIYVVTDF